MTKGYTLPNKLRLIFDHLRALRTLNDYVKGSMEADMQSLTNHVVRELNRDVLRPNGWEDLQSDQGCLWSRPRDKRAWQVVPDDNLALQIYLAWPVYDDSDTDTNIDLYVPEGWEQRQEFLDSLTAPPGFTHVRDCDESVEVDDTTSMIKFLSYEDFADAGGPFNVEHFIDALRDDTKTLVGWQGEIDKCLEPISKRTA
jgi:hypothetical protein